MLTNLVFKKFALSIMMLAMFSMTLMTIGCSENSDNPIANSNSDEVVVIITPDGERLEITQFEIDSLNVESESYQTLIEAMDPYVTENQDGTFHFNSESFMTSNPGMDNDGMKVYAELSEGILIINQQILEELKSPGSTALGVSCHYYWWGKRCCYTDGHAWWVVGVFNLGAAVPGFNIILFGFGQWAAYLTSKYGGFCLNQSWAGGFWLTSP